MAAAPIPEPVSGQHRTRPACHPAQTKPNMGTKSEHCCGSESGRMVDLDGVHSVRHCRPYSSRQEAVPL